MTQATDQLPSSNAIDYSPTGIKIHSDLSFEEWNQIGVQLAMMHTATPWFIGDWYNYGSNRYGEMAAQAQAIADAVSDSGWKLKPATVQDYAYMSKKFPIEQRVEELSFRHHMIVRGEPEPTPLLEHAKTHNLSASELKAYISEKHDKQESVPLSKVLRMLIEDVRDLIEEARDLSDFCAQDEHFAKMMAKIDEAAKKVAQYLEK